MTGCSRAQHWLALECERLSKLAGKPIAPQVQQVLRETQELFDREKPAATPLVTMQLEDFLELVREWWERRDR